MYILPCIQLNKLLIDIRKLNFKIPLISLLIKICQALKHQCITDLFYNYWVCGEIQYNVRYKDGHISPVAPLII